MERALVTLTAEESKRLIGKGIAALDLVRQAKKGGIIGFSMCTSAGYVIEEMLGRQIDLGRYCCGFVHADGMCFVHPDANTRQLVLARGEEIWLNWPAEDISKFIGEMGGGDIIVKSGNVLGLGGRAGVLVGCPDGGEIGKYLPYLFSSGIDLIVPMTLNKYLPVDIDVLSAAMGVRKLKKEHSFGMTVGLIPLPGRVFTEIDALKTLAGVKALPVATGGHASGEGSVSLLLEGDERSIGLAWDLVSDIKGEKPLGNHFAACRECAPLHSLFGMHCRTRRSFDRQ